MCPPTGILTYRDFNHATRLRRTPGYSCIWLMQQCMVTVRHMFVRWTATLLYWRSGSSIHSGYQSCGWSLVPERSIATFQFTHFTQSKSIALTLFHSLTGCDTTSQFLGCGKKTAWAVWNTFPDLTDTLVALTLNPNMFGIESNHMQRIERFVVLMYSKGCRAAGVNEARLRLFTSGTKSLESIPPTKAALFQHVKRAILQSSFYWHRALSAQQEIPDFSGWGWQKDNTSTWQPIWTTLDDASVACTTMLHCGCKKACTGRCKCNRAGVRCTALCKCGGGCFNNEGGDD